jgi:hypothetical protein
VINEHSPWLIAVDFSKWGTYGNIYREKKNMIIMSSDKWLPVCRSGSIT